MFLDLFELLLSPEGPDQAPLGPPEAFGMGQMRETVPKEAVECIIGAGQEAKKEILDN
jgi:hypothetical protein